MKLENLFNISYGQREYHSKGHLKPGNTLLISSQGKDNGCYGFFDIVPKHIKPIITVPSTGSIGYAFVQNVPCCVDDNCLVLSPKQKMSLEELFQIAHLLRKNSWRFIYGRQLIPERIKKLKYNKILLNTKYEHIEKDLMPRKNQENAINTNFKLEKFKLIDFFDVYKGKGQYFITLKKGKTPLVSATSENNGVIGYVDLKPTFKAPAITIERIKGKAFVQLYDFATVPDDIYVLTPKKYSKLEFLLYIASKISSISWRFNYSRKITPKRLGDVEISIPITENRKINMKIIRQMINQTYGIDKLKQFKNQDKSGADGI